VTSALRKPAFFGDDIFITGTNHAPPARQPVSTNTLTGGTSDFSDAQ
jgi:hypothetical protein